MNNEEKLHLEASAYADAQAKERHEQRTKNNMPPYDALQETRLWVAAYEGYVAGSMQLPLTFNFKKWRYNWIEPTT
jgi:hypothetical protein